MKQLRCFLAGMAVFCLLACCPQLLVAQSDYGSITGFVKDSSGGVVANAKVSIRNESTGDARDVTTNASGYYVVSNLPSGFYSMSAEVPGFKKFESTNNKLDPSATLAIDGMLTVGATTETVEVTASAQALQTETASVQKLVTREQIDALELNGRNPIGLASLVPGARGGNLCLAEFQLQSGTFQLQWFAKSGQPDHV